MRLRKNTAVLLILIGMLLGFALGTVLAGKRTIQMVEKSRKEKSA